MKPSNQSNKAGSSNLKLKKSTKDREKRKSLQGGSLEVNNHNATEKGSPTKESNARVYNGIDADLLANYAEQTAVEHLSEDVSNALTEDINYKLRYIINDSLVKARLSGTNAITSIDIEHTFENLKIDKVYGAPLCPNWVLFTDSLYCLDDKEINLVEIAREENTYTQYSDIILTTKWVPQEQQEVSKPLKNYFTTMCQMIVNSDVELQKMALTNISENTRIGPITEWFYNFGYILLSKDITYDCLTLRALDLITVLENSPTCRINVSEKQLRLLVRLILQRLLKSATTNEVLKPICNVLALLCIRDPLREFVILKILQKFNEVFTNYALPIVTIANSLGVDAIRSIVLPNLHLFLSKMGEKQDLSSVYSILESYNILCKENLVDSALYESFFEYFGDAMLIFDKPRISSKSSCVYKKDMNFAYVKCDLLRTRRTLSVNGRTSAKFDISEVFEMPPEHSKVRKKMDELKWDIGPSETSVVVGKTTLLLPVFQRKVKTYSNCEDHTLLSYNF